VEQTWTALQNANPATNPKCGKDDGRRADEVVCLPHRTDAIMAENPANERLVTSQFHGSQDKDRIATTSRPDAGKEKSE
jgi:hypothetical protein